MDWREENKLKQKAQEYYEKEFSYNQVYIQGYSDGYNKAIDEFAEAITAKLPKVEKDERVSKMACVADMIFLVDDVAEQMKAGGKNEID